MKKEIAMEKMPQEYVGRWKFNYHSSPLSADISVMLQQDVHGLFVEVPYGRKGILITLNHFDPEKNELKGLYRVRDLDLTNDITFHIENHQLSGFPKGF